MNKNIPLNSLPRYDLREAAFRKYERYIGRALHESYIIDTFGEVNKRASTFCARFRDAVLGFRTFKYESILFKQDANFDAIKLYELADGRVHVINNSLVQIETQREGMFSVSANWPEIIGLAERYHRHEMGDDHCTFISYSSDEERDRLIAIETPIGDYSIRIRPTIHSNVMRMSQ